MTVSCFFKHVPIGFWVDHAEKSYVEAQLVTPEKSWLGSKDDGDPGHQREKYFTKIKYLYYYIFSCIFFLFSCMYVSMIEITIASYILVFSQGRPDSNC